MSVTAVNRLRRFATRAKDHTTCDLCRGDLTQQHRHLLEIANRRILCACDACSLLFTTEQSGRFRPIPESVTRVDLNLTDSEWTAMEIPIGLVFFTVHASVDGPDSVQVGYPSPAGPVMASVEELVWQSLCSAHTEISHMCPDVESLLVNRTARGRAAFVVPLDRCFELIGIVRRNWQGWSGGPKVHEEIDRYFDQLALHAVKGARS